MFDSHRRDFERAAIEIAATHGHGVECTSVHGLNPNLVAARFELDNGLRIVLMPDRRAPVFAYQTWFRVGSKDEDPSRTGLAHLFEHLMFKGTKNHPTGELDREMERRGTQTNAATWVDWTYYNEALAARGDNFETVVSFEADRMVNLVLDEATFRSELEVVKNERRMVVDDSVGGSMSEALYATAYTAHPYRWLTIGSMAHLEGARLEDLERFYTSFYAPNNATVVVAGDLDVREALATLVKAYGPLERQPVQRPQRAAEPVQEAERRVVLRKPVLAPQLLLGYHAPAQLTREAAAMEMLGDALSSGDSARLHRRLTITEELCTDVETSMSPFAEPGLFDIQLTLRRGVEPDRVLAILDEELGRVAEGLSAREINKARNGLELSSLDGLRDADGCAQALGHYETNYGDFGLAFRSVTRFADIRDIDLERVAKATLRPENRTVVIALPEES